VVLSRTVLFFRRYLSSGCAAFSVRYFVKKIIMQYAQKKLDIFQKYGIILLE
jgi:hypothetical protein